MKKYSFPIYGAKQINFPIPSSFRGWCIFIFLFALMLYLPFLGDPLIRTADEGQRSVPAMEMVQYGRWAIPCLNGDPYLRKPPMIYWQVALAYKIFGVSEWAARVSIALCGALLALVTALWTKNFASERTAVIAGVICAANAIVVQKSRECQIDVPLALFITLSLWAWMIAFRKINRNENGWLLPLSLGGVALSVSHLYKFPMGAIFLGAAWISPIVLLWDFSFLKNKKWWAGAIITLLSVIPLLIWGILVIKNLGWDVVHTWAVEAKLHAVKATKINSGPLWYYIERIIPCFIPWIIWLPVLFTPTFIRFFKNSAIRLEWAFITGCVLLSFIVLSINTAKETEYMLGLVSPFSILLALSWDYLNVAKSSGLAKTKLNSLLTSRWILVFGFIAWIVASDIIFPLISHFDSKKLDAKTISSIAIKYKKDNNALIAVHDLKATRPYVYFYLGQLAENIDSAEELNAWWKKNPQGVLLTRASSFDSINKTTSETLPLTEIIYKTHEKGDLVLLKVVR